MGDVIDRDEAQLTVCCLLDYLSGSWATCTHAGSGLPGCPTCEGRWSTEVRRAVQAHRDRAVRAQKEADLLRALGAANTTALRHLSAWLLSYTSPGPGDGDDERHIGAAIAALMGVGDER